MTESRALLEVDDYSVRYGQAVAVDRARLALHAGQVVTVIGPNGAGKSSLLNAIMGLVPASGRLRFGAACDAGTPLEKRARAGMALVPEKRELFGTMTVADNLWLGTYCRGRSLAAMRDDVYALFPRLAERRRQVAATLSGGERQMLAIGRALMGAPTLLMLDEPSLGLAPQVVREIFQLVAGLRERGVGILLVEQNARAALRIADYGYVLENGCIVMEGEAATLLGDTRIGKTYLGTALDYREDSPREIR
ncbi:ABC transporter ATP-binding protein [Variovorax sp. JS1663]|uniref:ABC transporter ATP-binding protein n=1 Tax=Variovorax sp. JS1663 TaxID=1851577 RepID=UPI000B3477A6|nr:ABC transporter ATP-binding protein [Variovorax sp. JS1663]OUL99579.1 ABC transporter ATP-binding protein [Variovorax sp. JS1663]